MAFMLRKWVAVFRLTMEHMGIVESTMRRMSVAESPRDRHG
jgi:hypothetical protein